MPKLFGDWFTFADDAHGVAPSPADVLSELEALAASDDAPDASDDPAPHHEDDPFYDAPVDLVSHDGPDAGDVAVLDAPLVLDVPPVPAPAPVLEGAAGRAAEVAEIAGLYLSGTLDDAMKASAEDLLVAALDDRSAIVRTALAEAFADAEDAPRQIVLALASDLPRIAAIVAERTTCLLDVELLEIARTAGPAVLNALVRRRSGSARLTARLAERADADQTLTLLRNADLPLHAGALEMIVTRHGASPDVRDALLARRDLPAAMRLRLVDQAGARLAEGLAGFAGLTKARLTDVAARASAEAALEISRGSEAEAGALVAALQASSRLTPKLVLRAAVDGRIAFLIAALARLAGAGEARVSSVLSSHRSGPLDALCRRARLPQGFSDALRAAAQVMAEGDASNGVEDLGRRSRLFSERVLARYERSARREPVVYAALRGFAVEASRGEARRRAA